MIMMHKMKSVLAVGLMLMGTAVWAQTPPAEANSSTKLQAPIQPYADNPNLLHVWAYKAQQGVLNAADRVGEVADSSCLVQWVPAVAVHRLRLLWCPEFSG